MNKKILLSLGLIGIVAAIGIGGTIAYFSDTETSVGNTFTAGTIDITLDPSGGQVVKTVSGDLDLKPSQTGWTRSVITNVGTNPAEVWKHIGNVVNEENGEVEPEKEYYLAHPGSENWKISNWIHYDLYAGKVIREEYNTTGEAVEAEIEKVWSCCETTWTVDIISDNAPHGVYGVGLAISLDGQTPSFQVWYATGGGDIPSGYTERGWYYQPYPWSSSAEPVKNVSWIQVNERTGTPWTQEKHFEISIDCEYLGGPGATYYWAMQLKTNLLTWLGVYDWGTSATGFLENHVGTYTQVIDEEADFFLTGEYGVKSNWIYLGVLEPEEEMCVWQSYHLDSTVGNWGQSDKVSFEMDFMAQQTTPLPDEPANILDGYGRQ